MYKKRPERVFKLLILLLVAAVLVRRIIPLMKALNGPNIPIGTAHGMPMTRRPDAKKPWDKEPVNEPILAETLIQGATVQSYEIFGDSPDQMQESLASRSRSVIGNADASVAYHLTLYKGDPSDGSCGYSKAHVKAEITVLAPRWVAMPNATDEAKQWWSYRIKELAHQLQAGIDAATQEATLAEPEIQAATCTTGDAIYAGINQRLAAVHRPDASADVSVGVQFETPGAVVDATPANPEIILRQVAAKSSDQRTKASIAQMEWVSLDGDRVSMQSQKGKVLFLNFFATWCGPCRSEMPSLAALHEKMKNHEIFFAFVSNETASTVQSYASKTHLGLPFYLSVPNAPQPLAVGALPTTYIISKNGEVAFRHVGAMAWDSAETVKLLQDLETE